MSVTWIEASAGTGKTYTLVQTVLRLVRNEGMPVERILMVTFTEKATAELKTRIREGLREAWKVTREARLAQGLENLASMSITTIHGFCRTLLTQFPLESGVSFEPEMVDQGRQWRHLLREELRPRLTDLDPNLLAWAKVEDEEALLGLARSALERNLFSLPLVHPNAAEQASFAAYRSALETGQGPLWEALAAGGELTLPMDSRQGLGASNIETHLHSTWHKKPYEAVRALLGAKTFRDLQPLLSAESLKYVAKWTIPTGVTGSLWKKSSTLPLPRVLAEVVRVAQRFTEAVEGWSSSLPEGVALAGFLEGSARHALLEGLCRPVLARRSTRELTFHDLIDRVKTLVTQEGGSALAEGAAGRWDAVLIDEFQDTDPEQWDIFRSLFSGPDHQLVLVGDPKQSIYRFRGADLDVYRAVRAQVKQAGANTMILDENFRSTEPMVHAVNALFHPSRTPWEFPDDFTASRKGAKTIPRLVQRGPNGNVELPPLAAYREADERTWHAHLIRTVTELLDGRHFLDDGIEAVPLSPGDFLILVRKKKEAWSLYRQLTRKGLAATVGGSGGLLRGREAQEVLLFLKALESPRSLAAARALLWTSLFQGATLERLMPALDEAQADRDRGAFLRAFRRVAAALEPGKEDGGGLEHLLGQPEGPRLVTNTEHVLELVQERFHRGEVTPGKAALALETWIQSGMQEDEVDLRRAGETRTVRLLTVHAAKGLEAPIVLHGLPSSSRPDRALWLLAGGVDFLRTSDSVESENRQREAEDLRLRYVALTRARCHQVFIDPSLETAIEVPPPAVFAPWKAPEPVPRTSATLAPAIPGLEARHPWVESHSRLWRLATQAEAPDHAVWDRVQRPRDEENEGDTGEVVDLLPAGPEFGDLVHDILEAVDFRGADTTAEPELVRGFLGVVELSCQRSRGLFRGRDLTRALQIWLKRTLNHPFSLGEGTTPLVLSSLSPHETRRELEFHLPLAIESASEFQWSHRRFEVHPGFITGRIDLVFSWEGRLYLIDWKTNRLAQGQTPAETMVEAGYDLQAQWYWEALKRLSVLQKEPLTPGGVLYVFLRGEGVDPSGVFLGPESLNSISALTPFLRGITHA